jgi:hypothetical protein
MGVETDLGGHKELCEFPGQEHLGQLVFIIEIGLSEPACGGCAVRLAQESVFRLDADFYNVKPDSYHAGNEFQCVE